MENRGGVMAVEKMAEPARIPPRSDPSPPFTPPTVAKLILPALLLIVAAASLLGFWNKKGATGLAGAGLGLAIGGVISGVNYLLRRKAHQATGPRLVSAVMASVLASFGLFLIATVAVGSLWKEGVLPAILTALLIYLTVSYHDALGRRFAGAARK